VKFYDAYGDEIASLHTSCSQPLGPGTVAGDFEVTAGLDGDGAPLCDVPPPPDCVECGFGLDNANKVSELTLRFNGSDGTYVIVRDGKKDDDPILFEGTLNNGDTFTIRAADVGEDKFNSNVGFFDGSNNLLVTLHTSCSQPLGVGTVAGDFEVTAGLDKDGIPLCDAPPPPPPPPPGDDCVECGFGADNANKVSELTLRFNGADGTYVVVRNGKKDDDDVLFEGTLNNGDTFTIRASDVGKDELKGDVKFYDAYGDEIASLHTSCSQPLGPGTVAGDFEVTAGLDGDGVPLCDAPPPPDCAECKGGVIQLTLKYTGPDASEVKIVAKDVTYDLGVLQPGDVFTINGTKDDGKFEKNDLDIYFDGVKQDVKIHVSCS